MKNLLILALAFFCGSALAFGDQAQGQLQGQAQGQIQGQAQGQGQAQFAKSNSRSTALAGSTSTSEINITPAPVTLTVNEAAPPAQPTATYQEIRQNDYTIRTPASVVAPNTYPTAPCLGAWSAGISGVIGNLAGAAAGSTTQDDECGIRETARSFQNLNMTSDAITVLCSSKYAAVAPVCKKLAAGGEIVAVPQLPPAKPEPTCKTEIDGRGIRTTVCRE